MLYICNFVLTRIVHFFVAVYLTKAAKTSEIGFHLTNTYILDRIWIRKATLVLIIIGEPATLLNLKNRH